MNKEPLAEVNLIITEKNGKPCLEIRKKYQDTEIIKTILTCAFHSVPIILQPKFTDTVKATNTLIQKGIIYREDDNYYFTL